MLLQDKVAIITGAASGIGAATVREFLAAGARIVAVDLQEANTLQPLQREFPGRLEFLRGDVAEESTAQQASELALRRFSRVDILINNAGIAVIKKIHEHTPQEWDRVMDVNVKSVYFFARHIIPVMQRQRAGVILNTGSISSVAGLPAQGAYGPSKGAVVQMSRQMAIDYAAEGIRVNAVCPGTVDTPLLQKAAIDSGDAPAFLHRLASAHPIGRIADAQEIAHFFCFLASDQARFITGAVLMIDGGYTAQ
jgi:NAD(P)-dependent dehydrogenase (short-subunit alcohol dehydrogenase family)